MEEFREKMKSCIQRKTAQGRSKYSTYMNINPELETPVVYTSARGHKEVSMIAKLRTSSHNLQVEMGRRTATPRENRLCRCGSKVEDEDHFLTECELYGDIRGRYDIVGMEISQILGDAKFAAYIKELYEERNNHN